MKITSKANKLFDFSGTILNIWKEIRKEGLHVKKVHEHSSKYIF